MKHASLDALERMGIAFESFDRFDNGELIYARAENRAIEIEIEPISPRATRVRIAAKNGSFFYDSATASEIVAQTERSLATAGAARGGTVELQLQLLGLERQRRRRRRRRAVGRSGSRASSCSRRWMWRVSSAAISAAKARSASSREFSATSM